MHFPPLEKEGRGDLLLPLLLLPGESQKQIPQSPVKLAPAPFSKGGESGRCAVAELKHLDLP